MMAAGFPPWSKQKEIVMSRRTRGVIRKSVLLAAVVALGTLAFGDSHINFNVDQRFHVGDTGLSARCGAT